MCHITIFLKIEPFRCVPNRLIPKILRQLIFENRTVLYTFRNLCFVGTIFIHFILKVQKCSNNSIIKSYYNMGYIVILVFIDKNNNENILARIFVKMAGANQGGRGRTKVKPIS